MTDRYCRNCKMLAEPDEVRCLVCGGKTIEAVRYPRPVPPDKLERYQLAQKIERKCSEFDCAGRVVDIKIGPVITQYHFAPHRFTRIKQLKSLNEDLALALRVDEVSVQRVPGHAVLSIAVPNRVRRMITYQETLPAVVAKRNEMALPLNLGFDAMGEPVVDDLTRMPHLLIAGSTGSGKSVFLNGLLTSLLYVRSPKQMKLVLIDPKTVELFQYAELPHVEIKPVSRVYEALQVLETVTDDMRRRMVYLQMRKCKNLAELNAKVPADERLPYVVVVIEEIADLIIAEKKKITEALASISSVARAAGIHVIAVTQRPSVDVVSGKVKVNFPARISFHVPSQADSKTILNQKGAEQLMSVGDAYYLGAERPGLLRIHSPHTTKADVDRMLQLSLAVGHVHRTPSEASPEEIANLLASLRSEEEKREAAENTTIADKLMVGKKETVQ